MIKWRYGIAAGVALILGIALTVPPVQAAPPLQWFRGQLHTHSYWSDGRSFPEQAIDAYKQRGYHFLSITDHNRFGEDLDYWREVAAAEGDWPPDVTQQIFDAYFKTYGKDKVESKTDGSVTLVRLKTYAELKAEFEESGSFILMPGVEITQAFNNRANVHQNYINIPQVLPSIKGAELIQNLKTPQTVAELIAWNNSQAKEAANELQRPYLFFLNHPFWVYYDIVPQTLIDCPEIRFFEVCNGGTEYAPHPQAPSYSVEKFWDAVNAFRRLRGEALLYGIGSDDAHFYDAARINGSAGVDDAWIMVRAEALTPEHLIAAMKRGDFYATSGVLLEKIVFTPKNNTLRVKVKSEKGVAYRIHFIATKRGFDQTVAEIVSPEEGNRPERTIPLYSDDIGRVVKTVNGTKASYRLAADDLYVRARIESDKPSKYHAHFHPTVLTAWTQPYTPQ